MSNLSNDEILVDYDMVPTLVQGFATLPEADAMFHRLLADQEIRAKWDVKLFCSKRWFVVLVPYYS